MTLKFYLFLSVSDLFTDIRSNLNSGLLKKTVLHDTKIL